MKQSILLLFLALLFLSELDAQQCTANIPNNVTSINNSVNIVLPGAYWICNGGNVDASASSSTFFVENGGNADVSGNNNTVYVNTGGTADVSGQNNTIYVVNGGTLELSGLGNNAFAINEQDVNVSGVGNSLDLNSCSVIEFNYSDAPVGGCVAPPASPNLAFTIASRTVAENAGTVNISVSISNPNGNPTSVDVVLTGGSATNGQDFNFSNTTLNFPSNSNAAQSFSVSITDDQLDESNETIQFTLQNPSNGATISNSSFTLTITDNDEPVSNPPNLAFTSNAQTVAENVGSVSISVSITNPNDNPTSVDVVLTGGSATNGQDFNFNSTTLTFPANSNAAQSFSVSIIDDQLDESNETIQFTLQNPSNDATISNSSFTLTITDNDEPVSANCAANIPGNATINNNSVNIILPGVYWICNGGNVDALASSSTFFVENGGNLDLSGNNSTVYINTGGSADVSGEGNTIYVAAGGSLEVSGSNNTIFAINAQDVDNSGSNNTIDLNSCSAINFNYSNAPAGGCNAPPTPPNLAFTSNARTVAENVGPVSISVSITNPNDNPTSVDVVLTGGSATNGQDFNFNSTTLTFPANSSTDQSFSINIIDDQLDENNETIQFTLQNPSNGAIISNSSFTLTITDNDEPVSNPPNLAFTSNAQTVAENVGSVSISVSITNPNDNPTSVDVVLAGGSATNGQDFNFSNTTLTFPANSSVTQSFSVSITDDQLDESNETIQFTLQNPSNDATISNSSFTLTITDNDEPVSANCTADIPGNASIINNSVNIILPGAYWICNGGNVDALASGSTFFVENGGNLDLSGNNNTVYINTGGTTDVSGEGNTIYVAAGGSLEVSGSNNTIFAINEQDVNNSGSNNTIDLNSCSAVIFNYDNAPAGGCVITNTSQIIAAQILIFPNPSNGIIQLQFPVDFQPETYRIIAHNGKEVASGSLNSSSLHFPDLVGGIYYLQFSNKNLVVQKRIVLLP